MRFSGYEARMSHWVSQPVVVRTRDGAVVLSLDGTTWDGDIPPAFPAPDRIELHLRRYPDGNVLYDLVIDVESERCWFAGAEDESSPAAGAEALLEGAYERHVQAIAPDLLAQGTCPYCRAQLDGNWLYRVLGRGGIKCWLCRRTWQLPPGARLR